MYSKWAILFYFHSFNFFLTGASIQSYFVDLGQNATVDCRIQNSSESVDWVRKSKSKPFTILKNNSLFLKDVNKYDSGLYSCISLNKGGKYFNYSVNITVLTPPGPLNFTVVIRTVLAMLYWEVKDTGGYPILSFSAEYKLAISNEWKVIARKLSPTSSLSEVYNLKPNTTYDFRMWATNKLGLGDVVQVTKTTPYNNQTARLREHFLDGNEHFDTRIWIIVVGVFTGTFLVLSVGTSLLFYHECGKSNQSDAQETIELVPNIILNPGFEDAGRNNADENSNSETANHLNNNNVVQAHVDNN